ncbi:hypothetical protein [Microbacterium hydrocarbonoxydans]|uniref:hypothetical protein n=1 Tax=Microbacterium hydrocarbonoxydans TaxID=273678 RepID=UPI0013DB337C|nr:hypothetical protein [Microbacterium hydrocarbonoxydans]
MSNPDAFVNSQAPLPDLPSEELSDATMPEDEEQPETQGEEPQEAELGEDGQGDPGPEGEPDLPLTDPPEDLRDAVE